MCPTNNETPRFLQLYIYDTMNEILNRMRFFDNSHHRKLSEDVVRRLSDTLNSCNEYARLFKNATEMCDSSEKCDFSVRLYSNIGDRRYEPPAPGTLGGIVRADDSNASTYDIVIHRKDGAPQRTLGDPDINDPHNTRFIKIPPQYLVHSKGNRLHSLISFIYDETTLNNSSPETLSNRAIVCPTNDTSDGINKLVATLTPGECRIYNSHYVMIPHAENHRDLEALYPQEYSNQLSFPGIPSHQPTLKINTPVMLIHNINQSLGLCNGTRLLVTQLLPRIIEAQIITGTSIGVRVYIPRIKFVHDNKDLPFVFTRRQFPLTICYVMTINKSQGQSLKRIGIYLPKPVFTHGQLYVALSRATSPSSLKVLIDPTDDNPTDKQKMLSSPIS
ncbi:hypothetical protein CASFOL_028612 [Castilleja foliolosa]|uniref:ATP-dependent DNA helicase n=1 Tax=Castilleja foliolosa TaxID=1961234 RepID=A0ABD3CD56_9LAMI